MTGPGAVKFPSKMLSGVILGAQVNSEDRESIIKLIRENLEHVRVGMAIKDPWAYNLRVLDLGIGLETGPWDADAKPWRRVT